MKPPSGLYGVVIGAPRTLSQSSTPKRPAGGTDCCAFASSWNSGKPHGVIEVLALDEVASAGKILDAVASIGISSTAPAISTSKDFLEVRFLGCLIVTRTRFTSLAPLRRWAHDMI